MQWLSLRRGDGLLEQDATRRLQLLRPVLIQCRSLLQICRYDGLREGPAPRTDRRHHYWHTEFFLVGLAPSALLPIELLMLAVTSLQRPRHDLAVHRTRPGILLQPLDGGPSENHLLL